MRRSFEGRRPRVALPPGTIDTQMHFYPKGFAASPHGPPLPPAPPGVAEYRKVMGWLGIERVVVTQSNAYQADNSALRAVLAELGPVARGVAVVTPETDDAEIQSLHESGVRGARIMDLPGGAVGLGALAGVDAKIRAHGWLMAVQFDGTHLLTHVERLEAIQGRYIIDHHGKFFCGVTPDDARIAALKRLIDRGNCFFKLAGCYESSLTGPPDYRDIGAVARSIVEHAPERVIWGTNWPHVMAREEADYPDDAALTDLLLDWAPDERTRHTILVDTPAALFDF